DAVDLLLNGSGNGVGHDLGIGAGIACSHRDCGRRNRGILIDGKEEQGHAADQDDHNGQYPGKVRTIDEEAGKHEGPFSFTASSAWWPATGSSSVWLAGAPSPRAWFRQRG